jgi:hypothetical protein
LTTPRRVAGPVRAGLADGSFPSKQDVQELRREIARFAAEIASLRANITCPACHVPPPHLSRSTEDHWPRHTCGNARTVRMRDPWGIDLEHRGEDGGS